MLASNDKTVAPSVCIQKRGLAGIGKKQPICRLVRKKRPHIVSTVTTAGNSYLNVIYLVVLAVVNSEGGRHDFVVF